jgi:hypothetical protein
MNNIKKPVPVYKETGADNIFSRPIIKIPVLIYKKIKIYSAIIIKMVILFIKHSLESFNSSRKYYR